MAKVFRTHSTGTSQQDWFQSQQIGPNVVDNLTVQDTKGTKQPTSIPSPFARIDLVRTAFKKISFPDPQGAINIDGDSDAHKLVSDALDIGQMFFNFSKNHKSLQIERWNKQNQISALKNSKTAAHKHLGDTLDLFLTQDGKQYNFHLMNDIFILKYEYVVIGGTSPSTLFFASSRADKLNVNISFGNDRMLDSQLLPLYKRQTDYIEYLFSLSRSSDNFATLFPDFQKYLAENLSLLRSFNLDLFNKLQVSADEYYASLNDQVIPGNAGISVEVISGLSLKSAPLVPIVSDFEIKSSKASGIKPLVLPTDPFAQRWTYTSDLWDANIIVPVFDDKLVDERTLPSQGDLWPYLTLNDFLAPVLVKLPYDIDSDNFVVAGSKNFLLPLTKLFFKYFNASDIGDSVKLDITETEFGGITRVALTIPTKKGVITYTKKYSKPEGPAQTGDYSSAEGIIRTLDVGLAIYPFVKSDSVPIEYNIGLVNISTVSGTTSIKPILSSSANGEIETKTQNRANIRTEPFSRITNHFAFKHGFDLLELSFLDAEGYIIPKMPDHTNGARNFEFAIDFGTTNTHIEYKVATINAFEIEEKDAQIRFLRNQKMAAGREAVAKIIVGEEHLLQEMVPLSLGNSKLYKFPTRTCLIENDSINYNIATRLFNDANIGFDYEKKEIRDYLHVKTELKWSDLQELSNRERIKRFLEETLQLCKHKVLLNNGNLANTKITWFYPISMTGGRLNRLRTLWSEAFTNVFGDKLNHNALKEISESIAPFYYYKNNAGIMTQVTPAVSVDIGGGTSDVVVFKNGQPEVITSFKFAGNAIFGDGLNKNPMLNGFVQLFKEKYKTALKENELLEEVRVLEEIFQNNRSADFVNFLFSLSENAKVNSKNFPLKFETVLQETENLKIVFLHFYSSIFFHIAQLMKEAGLEKPGSILFSGTGAKTSFILNGNNTNFQLMERLINSIFDYVYNNNSLAKVKITIDRHPKEITAKGALSYDGNVDNVDQLVALHLGGGDSFKLSRPFIAKENSITYKQVGSPELELVLNNVKAYFKMMEAINASLSFKNTFSVTAKAAEAFNECIEDDRVLLEYIHVGFAAQKQDAGSDAEPLEETLFFYPFVGLLNDLAYKLSQNN
jgi:hypothetical protein